MNRPLIIGTRGSALALYQANFVEWLLKREHPTLKTEIKIIHTVGDKDRKTALAQVSKVAKVERGIFIKELEDALRAEEVDIAVHSLKDMPSVLNDGFDLFAYLPRSLREDVLVSKHPGGITGLPENAVVATGGVRRQAQLLWQRPDLKLEEMRGNVPTRLRKTANNSKLDATMLAAAGLSRLGYPVGGVLKTASGQPLFLNVLKTEEFLPAGGQGVIAVEGLEKNAELLKPLLKALDSAQTRNECEAERAFLHHFGATCDTPIAVMATQDEAGQLCLQGRYWQEGVKEPKEGEVCGDSASEVATSLTQKIKQ